MTFRWRGVQVSVSFWFFCGAVLLLSADRSGLCGLLLAAVAIHEGGHLGYMLLAKLPLAEVRLGPAGLIMRLEPGCRLSPGSDLALNLAGCAGNLLAAALLGLWKGGGMGVMRLSAVNAALCLANLLPVPGLDGAQALLDLLTLLLGWERGERLHLLLMRAVSVLGAAGCGFLLLRNGFHLPAACLLFIFLSGLWTANRRE